MSLDLGVDAVTLTENLVNIESVSGNEQAIADAVEAALRELSHLEVGRFGNTVVARTNQGHDERVVIAGHLDTVPLNDNLPARQDGKNLHGLGTCDMKGGCAVALKIAATMPVDVITRGERAHSARSWKGVNAIHGASDVLKILTDYQARKPVIDGLEYHEGLNAVFISGGVAGNVLPDECRVAVNYRFAPDRSEQEALAHMRDVFDGFEIEVSDSAPSAMPGLSVPAAAAFIEAVGGVANPKFGWTDVARFSELGIPAVNFGPGDPNLAHKQEEFVPLEHIRIVEQQLRTWLGDTR